MSAVIDITDPLQAADLAARRAKAYGYGAIAIAQMVRNAARMAGHGVMPVIAAARAVPRKCERNVPQPPSAA